MGWFPIQSGIYGIEVNGQSVSNRQMIIYSIMMGATMLLGAALLGIISLRNGRANRSLPTAPSD